MANAVVEQALLIASRADPKGFKDAGRELDALEAHAKAVDKAMTGMDEGAKKSAAGIEKASQQSSSSIAGVGKIAAGVATGMVAFQVGERVAQSLAAPISAAADFQQALRNVGAATGATEADMASLRKEALQVGKDTSKSASEAVEAFGELAKAGVSIADIVGGVGRTTVELAEATGKSIPQMATLMADTKNMWKLTAQEMAGIADLLAKTAVASTIDIGDLQAAFSNVGPVAASLGLNVRDTATALGILGNNGIKGAEAGTALRGMLLRLTAPTGAAKAIMDDLGVSVFDAAGKMRSLPDILGDLDKSLAPLSQEERTGVMKAIFDTYTITAGTALITNATEQWGHFNEQIDEAPGVAAQAQERLKSLQGQIEKFKGSVETLMIIFGEKALPMLTAVALAGTNALDWLISTDWSGLLGAMGSAFDTVMGVVRPVGEFLAENPELIAGVAIAIMAGMVPALVAWTAATLPLVAAQIAAAAAFVAANAPIVAVGLAIGLLIIGVRELIEHWDGIVEKVPAAGVAFDTVKAAVLGLPAAFRSLLDLLQGDWPAGWEGAAAVLDPFVSLVRDDIENVIQIARDLVGIVTALFAGDWAAAWEGARDLVGHVAEFFTDRLGNMKDIALGILGLIVTGVTEWGPVLLAAFAAAVGDAWQWIQDEVPTWPGRFIAFLSPLPGLAGKLFGEAKTLAVEQLGNLWGWIEDNVGGWPARIGGFLASLPGIVCDIVKNAASSIGGALSKGWEWVTTNVPGWPAQIAEALGRLVPAICDIGKKAVEGFVGFFRALPDRLGAALQFGIDLIKRFADMIDAVLDKLGLPKINFGGGSVSAGGAAPSVDTSPPPAPAAVAIASAPGVRIDSCLAMGGLIDREITARMGEDAPAYPEYVIPTHPRSRGRALGLLAAAQAAIRQPPIREPLGRAPRHSFAVGGPFGLPDLPNPIDLAGDALGAAMGTVGDWVKSGAAALVEKAISKFGFTLPDEAGLGADLVRGAWNMIKDGAIAFVQGGLDKAKAAGGEQGPWHLPLPPGSYTFNQGFGEDPGTYGPGGHPGVDLGAAGGTPILAAKPGEVTTAGWYNPSGSARGGYGNAVILQHLDALSTLYGHMSAMIERVGHEVAAGDTIGPVGTTGFSTGNHLHFEIRKGGVPIDPTSMIHFAGGGLITSRMLLLDPSTGKVIGELGESGNEAIVPLSGTGGGTTGKGGAGGIGMISITAQQVAIGGPAAPPSGGVAEPYEMSGQAEGGLSFTQTFNFGGIRGVVKSKISGPNYSKEDIEGPAYMTRGQLEEIGLRGTTKENAEFLNALGNLIASGVAGSMEEAARIINDQFYADQHARDMATANAVAGTLVSNLIPPLTAAIPSAAETAASVASMFDASGNVRTGGEAIATAAAGMPTPEESAAIAAQLFDGSGNIIAGGEAIAGAADSNLLSADESAAAAAQLFDGSGNIVSGGEAIAAAAEQEQQTADYRLQVEERAEATQTASEANTEEFGTHVDDMGNIVDDFGDVVENGDFGAADAAEQDARRRAWEDAHPGEVAPFAGGGYVSRPSILTDMATGRPWGTVAEYEGEWIQNSRQMAARGGAGGGGRGVPHVEVYNHYLPHNDQAVRQIQRERDLRQRLAAALTAGR